MNNIPSEIFSEIVISLNVRVVCRLSQCCKFLFGRLMNSNLWESLILRDFQDSPHILLGQYNFCETYKWLRYGNCICQCVMDQLEVFSDTTLVSERISLSIIEAGPVPDFKRVKAQMSLYTRTISARQQIEWIKSVQAGVDSCKQVSKLCPNYKTLLVEAFKASF